MPTVRRVLAVGLVWAALVVGAGCGSPKDSNSNNEKAAPHSGRVLRLPSLRMLDVGTGRQVDLASYQPKDKALLVWAWAPH